MFGRNDVRHIDFFDFAFLQKSAAREAFARNFACLRYVHKRLRVARFDDVFDAVDLLFGRYANDYVVFLASVVADGFGYRDASMKLYGKFVRDCVRFVRDDCEHERREQARFHHIANFGLREQRYEREQNGGQQTRKYRRCVHRTVDFGYSQKSRNYRDHAVASGYPPLCVCGGVMFIYDFAYYVRAADAQILTKHKAHRYACARAACDCRNEHKSVVAVCDELRATDRREHIHKSRKKQYAYGGASGKSLVKQFERQNKKRYIHYDCENTWVEKAVRQHSDRRVGTVHRRKVYECGKSAHAARCKSVGIYKQICRKRPRKREYHHQGEQFEPERRLILVHCDFFHMRPPPRKLCFRQVYPKIRIYFSKVKRFENVWVL